MDRPTEEMEQRNPPKDPYLDFLFEKSNTPEFKSLKTYKDIFKFSLKSLLEEKTTLEKIEKGIPTIKSSILSTVYRHQSIEEYKSSQSPDFDIVIECCTKSIAYAELNTTELTLAYMNRCSALFKSNLYDDCLNDIEYLINNIIDLNDSQKVKLLVRKAICYEILEHNNLSNIDILKNEIRHIADRLESNDKSKIMSFEYLNNTNNNNNNNNTINNKKPFKKIIFDENEAKILNKNNDIIGASDAIKIVYSDDVYGRHIVATRDIKPGEALLLYKPFATYLVKDAFYQFCSYCMKQTWSGISCNNCVYTIYCSEKCRNNAWDEYHDVECDIIGLANMWGLEERPMLAFKMTIMAVKEAGGIEQLKKKLVQLDKINNKILKGSTNGIFDSSKYASVYSLSTEIDKKRSDQVFHYSNVAVIFTYLLATNTLFFGKKIPINKPEQMIDINNLLFIGQLLLQNCVILKTNACSIGDYENDNEFDERSIALMPILSLFNHGCFCKTTRFEFNDKISLQTTCFIEKGEQIFVNYGNTFESSPPCQRKQSIQMKYNFNCQCNACDNNWPADLSSLPVMPIPHQIANQLIHVYKLYHTALRTDEEDGVIYFDDTVDRKFIKKEIINVIEALYPHVNHPSQDLITFMEMLTTILGSRSTRWQTLN